MLKINDYKKISLNLLTFLSQNKNVFSAQELRSPRAIGDILQNLVSHNFDSISGYPNLTTSNQFARRSMADFAITDDNQNYYVVDVKTHNLGTDFNMPNLTSVERLSRFYEDDANTFIILMVAYKVENETFLVQRVEFMPIEKLSWKCLTIGALGWGQIQIANSNFIELDFNQSRKDWMLKMCDRLAEFYPSEISKINDRIIRFEKVRQYWLSK